LIGQSLSFVVKYILYNDSANNLNNLNQYFLAIYLFGKPCNERDSVDTARHYL